MREKHIQRNLFIIVLVILLSIFGASKAFNQSYFESNGFPIYFMHRGAASFSTPVTPGIPYADDLLSNYSIRQGNFFIDPLNNDTAEILIPEFKGNGAVNLNGDKTNVKEHILDGNDYTVYFRIKQTDLISTTTYSIINIGRLTTGRGIRVYFFTDRMRVNVSDGTVSLNAYLYYGSDTILFGLPYADVVIQVNGTTKMCDVGIYNPDGDLINTNTLGVRTNAVTNINMATVALATTDNGIDYTFVNDHCITTNFKKFTGLKTYAQCINNSYTTNAQLWYPNILSGTNILADENHLFKTVPFTDETYFYYTSINSYLLDYGFDEYQYTLDDSRSRIVVPYKPDGSKITIDFTAPAIYLGSYRVIAEQLPRANGINLVSGKVRFSNAFFNRKNATIWNSLARSGYYSATDTMAFKISELNQRTINEMLNPNYRGRLFVDYNTNSIEKWDRDFLTNIYLYSSDHTTAEHKTILNYTGDLFASVGGTTTPTYDSVDYVQLGYLQSDSAMLSFRIDDGDISALTGWKPVFDTSNIDAIVGIHTSEVGTVGTYTYMSWTQLNSLVNDGWELADHVNNEIDLNVVDYLDSIEIRMNIAQQQAMDSIGYDLKYFIGNRHSSENASIPYYAHKVGYDAQLGWGVSNDTNGTNYKKLDLYKLSTISADLEGDYYLEDLPATTEINNIKHQIDIAKVQKRWTIIFVHTFSQDVSDGLAEVIQYAIDEGVGLVPFSTAINSLKYLPK